MRLVELVRAYGIWLGRLIVILFSWSFMIFSNELSWELFIPIIPEDWNQAFNSSFSEIELNMLKLYQGQFHIHTSSKFQSFQEVGLNEKIKITKKNNQSKIYKILLIFLSRIYRVNIVKNKTTVPQNTIQEKVEIEIRSDRNKKNTIKRNEKYIVYKYHFVNFWKIRFIW